MDGVLIAVFGGCGVAIVELIKFLLTRKDKQNDNCANLGLQIGNLDKKVDQGFANVDEKFQLLQEDIDERQAKNTRVRILRYADELMEGRKHSKESYDQTLIDIDEYEKYCEHNPDFENNRTVLAAQRIKDIYKRRLVKQDFL